MLNRDICERCFREAYKDDKGLDVLMAMVVKSWDEGKGVYCAWRIGQSFVLTDDTDRNDDPPTECPYAVEHVVNQNAE